MFRTSLISFYVVTGLGTAHLGARGIPGDVNENSPAIDQNATLHHYEYVLPDGYIYVYDTDNNFQFVKSISIPTSAGTRGAVASAATGMLYISYGPDGCCDGSLLKYDLVRDQVVWTRTYSSFGIDSMSISPDGQTLYMPTGENNSGGLWNLIDAASGNVIGVIDSGGAGPHNTVLNASGTHVYMGPRGTNYLVEADTATLNVIRNIGPVDSVTGPGVRPFTINGNETLAFITATGLLGFQVADIAAGSILYEVPIIGFGKGGPGGPSAPSHGISISPDEHEIYVMDSPNSYVHVFDISGLPGSAPVQVADIPLVGKMNGSEQGCGYDCLKEGWLHHSRDGRYVFVGDSGDIVDTVTRSTVTTLPTLANTRKFLEIDFRNGVPVWAMTNRSSIGGVMDVSLVGKQSGKCLDVAGGKPTADWGASADVWTCSGATNQKFRFTPTNGDYQITVESSNLQLDVHGSSTTNGVPLIQWPLGHGANEIWQLVPTTDGYVTLIPEGSDSCMDVRGRSTSDGATVQLWTCWGGDNQRWKLAPAQ